jgi:hypothetical protein
MDLGLAGKVAPARSFPWSAGSMIVPQPHSAACRPALARSAARKKHGVAVALWGWVTILGPLAGTYDGHALCGTPAAVRLGQAKLA